MKKILTIAGYDPSSGAGVTRDMDTFFSLGTHGVSVPTCIVIQGPQGVSDVYPIPIHHFSSMLRAAAGDTPVDGLKVGVVWDKTYVEAIRSFLDSSGSKNIPIVVDPVAAAKNGMRLNTEAGTRSLLRLIFPISRIITPNIDEAALITGKKIRNLEDMKEAAKVLFALGPRAVVVKGGHLEGEPVDLLYDGSDFTSYSRKRIEHNVHGTGCTFSSLLLAYLVLGRTLKDAFFAAEEYMDKLLRACYRIDREGYFYVSSVALNAVGSDQSNRERGYDRETRKEQFRGPLPLKDYTARGKRLKKETAGP